jgi:hypothetical protein
VTRGAHRVSPSPEVVADDELNQQRNRSARGMIRRAGGLVITTVVVVGIFLMYEKMQSAQDELGEAVERLEASESERAELTAQVAEQTEKIDLLVEVLRENGIQIPAGIDDPAPAVGDAAEGEGGDGGASSAGGGGSSGDPVASGAGSSGGGVASGGGGSSGGGTGSSAPPASSPAPAPAPTTPAPPPPPDDDPGVIASLIDGADDLIEGAANILGGG